MAQVFPWDRHITYYTGHFPLSSFKTFWNFKIKEPFIYKGLYVEKRVDLRHITFIAGDFFEDKIGQDYDFVWVSSIIHSLGEEEIKWLLKQVYRSLKPKGRIAVRDFLLDETCCDLLRLPRQKKGRVGSYHTKKDKESNCNRHRAILLLVW